MKRDDLDVKIGERLREAREKAGLSQAQLAKALEDESATAGFNRIGAGAGNWRRVGAGACRIDAGSWRTDTSLDFGSGKTGSISRNCCNRYGQVPQGWL